MKNKSCNRSIFYKSPSKSSSKPSSTSRNTYLLILERPKTAELAKVLAIQAEECSKRKIKSLEKLYEVEKEKHLGEVIKEHNEPVLVEMEHKLDENIASWHSADSVKEQIRQHLFLYNDLKEKKYQKTMTQIIRLNS